MSAIGRAWRRRGVRKSQELIDRDLRASAENPVQLLQAAIEAECGFPRFKREPLDDYAARAAGVSRELFDRYRAHLKSGGLPLPEMAGIHDLMERAGKRLYERLHA